MAERNYAEFVNGYRPTAYDAYSETYYTDGWRLEEYKLNFQSPYFYVQFKFVDLKILS